MHMASKTERLSLRLTPEQDAVLRRAAEARGESANDFVVRNAVEAAEMELADRRVFLVDDSAWEEPRSCCPVRWLCRLPWSSCCPTRRFSSVPPSGLRRSGDPDRRPCS